MLIAEADAERPGKCYDADVNIAASLLSVRRGVNWLAF